MKPKIHPEYGPVLFRCAACGNEFVVRTTKLDGDKREHEGKEYPSMTLEICSQCHPFFSGKQVYVDTAGRVEKFQQRYGSLTGVKEDATKDAKKEDAKEEKTDEQASEAQPAEAAASSPEPAKSES